MAKIKLEPVKYELFYNKLATLLDESKEIVRYLSGSTITKEAGEVVQALFNVDGEAVHMACGILIHIGAATRCIRYALKNKYDEPGIGIYDGDMFINNDAYIGGAHVPDTAVAAPIFHKGKLIGWTAALSHTSEIGAIEPGGMCYTATESVHEGLHLPMVKLIEKGQMRRDIFNMILRSTRDPRAMEMDIRARIAGCERVKRRIAELIEELGIDFYIAASEQMIRDMEVEAREKIKQLRPGIYMARGFDDSIGIKGDKPAIFNLAVEITEDGAINITAPVISSQCDGYTNLYLAGVESFTFCTLLQTLFYDTRWNSGLMKLIRVDFPPHSRLNADPDRATGGITSPTSPYTCALIEALSQAFYVSGKLEDVEAPENGAPVPSVFKGIDREKIFRVQMMMAVDSYGSGGRLNKDGKDSAICAHANPWNHLPDTEAEEMILPMLSLGSNQQPDSGGPGKFRGGVGLMTIDKFPYHGENCTCGGIGNGSYLPAGQGLWGGYPAGRVYRVICTDTDIDKRIEQELPLPHSMDDLKTNLQGKCVVHSISHQSLPCQPGDIVASVGRGGCGLGDPIEREPELIVEDIRNKRATLEISQKVYYVSIDPKTLEVDHNKTKKMREEKRKQRLSHGIPAGNYLKALVEKRKKREFSQIALNFMDETVTFSPAYQEQLENEEKLSQKELKPLVKVKVIREILDLTPYVKIVEDENRRKVSVCSVCGFAYCEAQENYKLYTLIYERDPMEIYGPVDAYPHDWCVYREFYCPGCGTQISVEAIVPGIPIMQDVILKKL
jgi:N-methylhydantoinase B/oxoprolinase/acetone carboxylase alpha subunit